MVYCYIFDSHQKKLEFVVLVTHFISIYSSFFWHVNGDDLIIKVGLALYLWISHFLICFYSIEGWRLVILSFTPYNKIQASNYDNGSKYPVKINISYLSVYNMIPSSRVTADINNYLPKYIFSCKMKELKIATITMLNGLKAVTKTGPLSFMTTP